jgi:hypothetical protein
MREYFEGVYWCGHSVLMTSSPFMEVACCNILGNRLKKKKKYQEGIQEEKKKESWKKYYILVLNIMHMVVI